MLNYTNTRYSFYISNILKTKKPINIKKLKKIKQILKKYYINVNTFTKQKQLNVRTLQNNNSNKLIAINIKLNTGNKINIPNHNFFFKNDLIKTNYYNMYTYYNKHTHNAYLVKNYILNNFFNTDMSNKTFYFVNKIKFFLNQKLVKQNILIQYNNIYVKKNYTNYDKFFKHIINYKSLIFLCKTLNTYAHYKSPNNGIFYKYNIFMRKFVNSNLLILLLI